MRPEALLAHATEFTFKPDYGALKDEFDDDVEHRDAIVLAWRGPAVKGGDPDRWAIKFQTHYCWSNSEGWVWEPSAGNRTEEFIAETRFSLEEATYLVPTLLADIQAERIPQLQAKVDSWNKQPEKE